jgi:hypothetical protein
MLISNLDNHKLQEHGNLPGLRVIFSSNNGWGIFVEELSNSANKVRQPFLQKKMNLSPKRHERS